MPSQLVVDRLAAGYGRVEVLHDVSLRVPTGHVVALLGPNGAGKTTTLGAISGTVPATRGRILLGDTQVTAMATDERARLGITLIPEGRGVFPGLSVQDNLEVAVNAVPGLDGDRRARQLDRVLTIFPRLRERSRQAAGTLSGGEQQMLSMSRAFLTSPKILMMDEISMGLAPQVVAQLFDAVQELRDEGGSILLVEQYLTYALRLADVCYVLRKGEVAFVGEPGELRDSKVAASYVGG